MNNSTEEKPKTKPFKVKQMVAMVCLCLMTSVLSIALYDKFYALKIVKIDTTPYIQKIRKEFVEGKLTEKELDERLLSLKSVIHSQPANKVILMSDMVVSQNVETIKP